MRPVFDIEGKEHGGYNDTPKTWWLYMGPDLIDGVIPQLDSHDLIAYSCSIIRCLWEFSIKQNQYSKHKWDEIDIRSSITVEMKCNGKVVYVFSSGGKYLYYAMAKIQVLQVQLSEHPFNFFEPETEQGRLIYFYGLPAKVRLSYTPGEIHIEADYTAGVDKNTWWKEYASRRTVMGNKKEDRVHDEADDQEDTDEYMGRDSINWGDALSDGNIDWFRK